MRSRKADDFLGPHRRLPPLLRERSSCGGRPETGVEEVIARVIVVIEGQYELFQDILYMEEQVYCHMMGWA